MKDHQVQQAFREKLALCTIIAFLMAAVAFLTFGFQSTICIAPQRSFPYNTLPTQQDVFSIAGITYFLPTNFVHPTLRLARNAIVGKDLTFLFPRNSTACNALGISRNPFTCTTAGVWPLAGKYVATFSSTKILAIQLLMHVILKHQPLFYRIFKKEVKLFCRGMMSKMHLKTGS